jgi:hypothetical protein
MMSTSRTDGCSLLVVRDSRRSFALALAIGELCDVLPDCSRLSASTTLRCYCHRIQMLGRHALASDMIGDIVANPALRSAKDDDRFSLLAKQGSRLDRSSAQ